MLVCVLRLCTPKLVSDGPFIADRRIFIGPLFFGLEFSLVGLTKWRIFIGPFSPNGEFPFVHQGNHTLAV